MLELRLKLLLVVFSSGVGALGVASCGRSVSTTDAVADSGNGGSPGEAGIVSAAGQAVAAGAGAGGDHCDGFDFGAVTARLAKAVNDNEVPGAGLIIVTAECAVPLYQHTVGNQTEASVLELASASKLPSAALLLRLAQAGQLSLADPVAKFIPNWPVDKVDITIRQLLSHTSGLPSNSACLSDPSTTLEACAAAVAQEPLIAKPGTAFNYGGSSFQVAGRVAEIAGGQLWNELFSRLLAKPCGLDALSFAATASNHLGSASNPRIAGGAASNLADYGVFLRMFLNGGACAGAPVLAANTLSELSADELLSVSIGSSPLPKTWGYGLGLWREPAADGSAVTVFSDPGAFGAYPWFDTQRGYGAFLLVKKDLKVSLGLVSDLRVAINAGIAR